MKISSLILPFAGVRGRKADSDSDLAKAAKILGVSVHSLASIVTKAETVDSVAIVPFPDRVEMFRAFACNCDDLATAIENGDSEAMRLAAIELAKVCEFSPAEAKNLNLD